MLRNTFLVAAISAMGPCFSQFPWYSLHGEQRTRYENSDRRYRLGEVGSDQQMTFRTRLRATVDFQHWLATGEVQDSRVALTDSGSTVNTSHQTKTQLLQGHVGYRFTNLTARKLQVSLEAGRFTWDLGGRRLMGRNNFRNTTNAFDGVMAKFESGAHSFSLQAFDFRPVTYTYPQLQFDSRYRHARLKGVFFTHGLPRSLASAEAYLLHMNDGKSAPVAHASRFLRGWIPGISRALVLVLGDGGDLGAWDRGFARPPRAPVSRTDRQAVGDSGVASTHPVL